MDHHDPEHDPRELNFDDEHLPAGPTDEWAQWEEALRLDPAYDRWLIQIEKNREREVEERLAFCDKHGIPYF
jgi:hypothetical protein